MFKVQTSFPSCPTTFPFPICNQTYGTHKFFFMGLTITIEPEINGAWMLVDRGADSGWRVVVKLVDFRTLKNKVCYFERHERPLMPEELQCHKV